MNKPNELNSADLGAILFAAAVAQMRADALRVSARKAARELAADEVTQRMLASFRKDRAARIARGEYTEQAERTQAEIDAEMLANFDRLEAMAINAGRY